MFRGVNKVIVLGILGADPDVKYMPSGKTVVSINVATVDAWKDKTSGEPISKTEWHKVVFYNKLGDVASSYLKKGLKVYIEGSLRTNKWEDKNGIIRYFTEIVAANMQILSFKSNNLDDGKNVAADNSVSVSNKSEHGKNAFHEDIPF